MAERSDFGRDVCIRAVQVARPVPEPRGAVPAVESAGLLGLEALCTEEQKGGRFLREDSENCRGVQTTFWSALCPHECSPLSFNPTPPCYTFGQYLKACLGKHQELSGLFAAGNLTPPKCVTMNRIWPESHTSFLEQACSEPPGEAQETSAGPLPPRTHSLTFEDQTNTPASLRLL